MDIYAQDDFDCRPSWDVVYMDWASSLSARSTCVRLQVGCIITSIDNHRVLAIGYNGNYAGGPNTCDSDEPGNCGCIHAEMNAIIKLDYNDPTYKKLYTTHSPCKMCAKAIINAGIHWVMYGTQYRNTAGLELLSKNNVLVYASPF